MEFNEFRNDIIKLRKLDKDFFSPSIQHITDINKLKNIDLAVDTIKRHIDDGSSIVVYADVDIDGVSATIITYKWLKSIGADVSYIHHSKIMGHGVLIPNVPQCDLLIVVDSTSSDTKRIKTLLDSNTIKESIIIDHHEIESEIVDDKRIIVVNPYQDNCNYENKHVSGALLTWIVFEYLENKYEYNKFINSLSYLASMSIVSDSMNIFTMENRYYYYSGNSFNTPAFQAIDSWKQNYSSKDLALSVNTKLNAAIREGEMQLVFDFLLSDDLVKAKELLKELEVIYKGGKAGVNKAIDDMNILFSNDKLVLAQTSYPHKGYLAGRIANFKNKNVIVISDKGSKKNGKTIHYGSARSLQGVELKDIVNSIKEVKCVGHQQAFGVNVLELNKFISGLKKINIPEPSFDFDFDIDVNSLDENDVAYGAYCNFLTGNGYKPVTYRIESLIIQSIGATGTGNMYFNDEKGTRYSQYNNKWLEKYKSGDIVNVIGSITNETWGIKEQRVMMVDYIESGEDIWI